MAIIGYARVSTLKQKQGIRRQIEAIKKEFSDATIIQEEYTGTTSDRPKWSSLMKNLKDGDVLILESVSRMSRNAREGYADYTTLYDRGVKIVFVSQHEVDTDVYRNALQKQIDLTVQTGDGAVDTCVNAILAAVDDLVLELRARQFEAAFQSSEDEVTEKDRNTAKGVQLALKRYDEEELLGLPHKKMRPGRQTGAKIETAKAKEAKEVIRKHCKDFGGSLTDQETMKQAGVSRNSYFKYKRQIREELEANASNTN